MKKINWCGPLKDSTGYAEFSRNWVSALYDHKIPLSVEVMAFEQVYANHGKADEIVNKLLTQSPSKPDVNIINIIPTLFHRFRKPNCMNLGVTMFESTRVCDSWVNDCNQMDAIIVPCEQNKEAFINSGVKVPVEVITPGVNESEYPIKKLTPGQSDRFKFYSIFQWSDRKNPEGLITAFLSAFSGNPNVSLTLKTYMKDYSKEDQDKIRQEIMRIKNLISLPHQPNIMLKHEKLSRQAILNFHMENDAFVLPSRAEAVGLGHLESMMIGNPTLGTNFAGSKEFMTMENSWLLDYQLRPITNMNRFGGWYDGRGMWAEPNLEQLIGYMKDIYANQDAAKAKAAGARGNILSKLGWAKQIGTFKDTIERLYANWKGK